MVRMEFMDWKMTIKPTASISCSAIALGLGGDVVEGDHRPADGHDEQPCQHANDGPQPQEGEALALGLFVLPLAQVCAVMMELALEMPWMNTVESCWVTVVMEFAATKVAPMRPMTMATALLPRPRRVSLTSTGMLMRR